MHCRICTSLQKIQRHVKNKNDEGKRMIWDFPLGVKVGPGARLPRLPALHRPKRRWKLAGQGNPEENLEAGVRGAGRMLLDAGKCNLWVSDVCVLFKADVETTKKISVDARPTGHSGAAHTGMARILKMK